MAAVPSFRAALHEPCQTAGENESRSIACKKAPGARVFSACARRQHCTQRSKLDLRKRLFIIRRGHPTLAWIVHDVFSYETTLKYGSQRQTQENQDTAAA